MSNKLQKVIRNSIYSSINHISKRLIDYCIRNATELVKSKIMIHKSYKSFEGEVYSYAHWIGNVAKCDRLKDILVQNQNGYIVSIPIGIYYTVYKETLIILLSQKQQLCDIESGSRQDLDIYILGKNKVDILIEMNRYTPVFNNTIIRNDYISRYFITDQNYIQCQPTVKVKQLDEVFINHNERNQLINFLNKFTNNRDFYEKRCIQYKTGILLYGDPGTGKTTLIKAIASYLQRSITYIDDPIKCNLSLVQGMQPNTILVMEDLDRYFEVDEHGRKQNISNILNILDGSKSIENCVVIASVNDKSKLDPALLRKGRIDLALEIKALSDKDVAEEMCRLFEQDPEEVLKDMTYPYNQSELQAKLLEMRK